MITNTLFNVGFFVCFFQNHAKCIIHSVKGGAMKPIQYYMLSQGGKKMLQEDGQCDKILIFPDNLILDVLPDFGSLQHRLSIM